MSNGFPCPNPSCTQVFPPEAVKGATALTCPRCGTVYQFRNPAADRPRPVPPRPPVPPPPPRAGHKPPPPPPPPPARPLPPPVPPALPANPRIPPPLAPVAPVAAPVDPGLDPALAFDEGPVVTVGGSKRKRRRGRGWLTGLFVFLVIGGAAAAPIYYYREQIYEALVSSDSGPRGSRAKGNFGFRIGGDWRADSALREKIQANLVVSRARPKGHMALFYHDFNTRLLSDGELLDLGLKNLRGAFPRLEYENPLQSENRGRTGTLGGEDAIVMPFSASDGNDVPVRGECYMLARQGYAYWLVFWSPEDFFEEQTEAFESLRERFKLYDEREGWKPTPRETERFTGATVPYQLNYVKEVWRREPNAKDADPAAQLFLRGFEPTLDKETGRSRVVEFAGKAAEVLVVVLPGAADLKAAVTAADEHFRKKQVELHPAFKMEPVSERKTGKPLVGSDVGTFHGQVSRRRLLLDSDTERFALVAIANRPEGVLVVWGECKWDRREYWEQEFLGLIKTIRPAGEE